MEEKEFFIFYYEVDKDGNLLAPTELFQKIVDKISECLEWNQRVLFLPNCVRKSWGPLKKEETLRSLQQMIDWVNEE